VFVNETEKRGSGGGEKKEEYVTHHKQKKKGHVFTLSGEKGLLPSLFRSGTASKGETPWKSKEEVFTRVARRR